MTGFILGLLTAAVAYKVLRARGYVRGGQRRRPWLRWLYRRLDTSYGQEKVVGAAVESLHTSFADTKSQLRASVGDLSRALRSDALTEEALEEAWRRQDDALGALRQQITASLGELHETLDDQQRETLADMLERGPGGRCGYRRPQAASAL